LNSNANQWLNNHSSLHSLRAILRLEKKSVASCKETIEEKQAELNIEEKRKTMPLLIILERTM